jgi:hypothetical protein
MSPSEYSSTSFLNIDIDLRAQDGLDDLINHLGEAVFELHRSNGFAVLELAKERSSLEETIRNIVDLIRGLPPEAEALWKRCEHRGLNIGIQAGHEPYQALFVIPNELVRLVADAGFDIIFTVYAARLGVT